MLENRSERGQTLIIFIMCLTIIMLVGAIAVDVGLWLSERRGSQTDADFAALSGAWELIDPAATANDARSAATVALNGNDEQSNASFIELPGVDLVNRCVSVKVKHDSRALFFQYFGIMDDPDIGAYAKACAGAVQAPGNLIPFQIDDDPGPCFTAQEEPILTSMCPLELGAQGGGSGRGMVDLEAEPDYCSDGGGSGDIEDMIINGAPGICLINSDPGDDCGNGPWYSCAAVQNGNPKKVLDGVNGRVEQDGGCDTDNDGVDEFFETIQIVFDSGNPFTSTYEPRDCDPNADGLQMSPRLVTIIVFEEDPPNGNSNDGYPIVAFASFYLAGCAPESVVVTSEAQLDPDCNAPGNADYRAPSDSYVAASAWDAVRAGSGATLCHRGTPHGQQTCPPTPSPTLSPTPTPGGPTGTGTPTPTPSPSPSPSPTPPPQPTSCGPPGHCVVYGRFVKLITSGGEVGGPPTDQTTMFGISLVE